MPVCQCTAVPPYHHHHHLFLLPLLQDKRHKKRECELSTGWLVEGNRDLRALKAFSHFLPLLLHRKKKAPPRTYLLALLVDIKPSLLSCNPASEKSFPTSFLSCQSLFTYSFVPSRLCWTKKKAQFQVSGADRRVVDDVQRSNRRFYPALTTVASVVQTGCLSPTSLAHPRLRPSRWVTSSSPAPRQLLASLIA